VSSVSKLAAGVRPGVRVGKASALPVSIVGPDRLSDQATAVTAASTQTATTNA
jgi:hypothetical protein